MSDGDRGAVRNVEHSVFLTPRKGKNKYNYHPLLKANHIVGILHLLSHLILTKPCTMNIFTSTLKIRKQRLREMEKLIESIFKPKSSLRLEKSCSKKR